MSTSKLNFLKATFALLAVTYSVQLTGIAAQQEGLLQASILGKRNDAIASANVQKMKKLPRHNNTDNKIRSRKNLPRR